MPNLKYAESKIANICEKIRKTKIHKFYQTSAAKPCYRSIVQTSFSVQMIDGEPPNDGTAVDGAGVDGAGPPNEVTSVVSIQRQRRLRQK